MTSDFLPLPEASIELGQSISTLRRRIKRQDIEYRQVSTPQGYQYWVRVDKPDHIDQSISTHGLQASPPVDRVSFEFQEERRFWMHLVDRLQKDLDFERRRPRSFLAHVLDFFIR